MGTKRCGHKETWAQRDVGTKYHFFGHIETWAQRDVGTKYHFFGHIETWAQRDVGTKRRGHKEMLRHSMTLHKHAHSQTRTRIDKNHLSFNSPFHVDRRNLNQKICCTVSDCHTGNTSDCCTGGMCPTWYGPYVAPFMLAFYMVLTSVLLLNLLIAKFK